MSSSEIDAFFDDVPGGPVNSGAGNDIDEFFEDGGMIGGVPDAPADDLLHRMKQFILLHTKQLNEMREALSDTHIEAYLEENHAIQIDLKPFDGVPLLALIHQKTPNEQLNKVIAVFAYLVEEINILKKQAEEKFYGPLQMFGHDLAKAAEAAAAAAEGESASNKSPDIFNNGSGLPKPATSTAEQEMGDFMTLLQELSNFVTRVVVVCRNLVNQLACLFHERQKMFISTFKYVMNFDAPFIAIGTLTRILITLDSIIVDNPNLATAWSSFKRMIKYVRADPLKYGLEIPKLRVFEQLLVNIDRQILSGRIFQSLLDADFGLSASTSSAGVQGITAAPSSSTATASSTSAPALIAGNSALFSKFAHVIRTWYKRLTHSIFMVGQENNIETFERSELIEVFGLYALFRSLYKNTVKPDKKLFTDLWLLQKKIPLIILHGRAVFFPADFLGRYAPVEVRSLPISGSKAILSTRQEWLAQMDDIFAQRTDDLYVHLSVWMVRIESELAPSATDNISNILNARAKLLLNGIILANQIKNLVATSLHLHLSLQEPFRAKNIRAYAICCEMLKSIQLTYSRRISMIAENLPHMIAQTCYAIKRILTPLQEKLEKSKKKNNDDAKLDILASIILSKQLLDHPPTDERLYLLSLLLPITQFQGMLKDNQHAEEEMRYQMWKLHQLSHWQETVKRICSTSFLYWISNLVPAIFEDIFTAPDQVTRLPYLFMSFTDVFTLFQGCAHEQKMRWKQEYKQEITQHLHDCILNPLCREVETDLRLHIHSVVLQQANLRNQAMHKDLSRFIDLKPLPFFDVILDMKHRVTHYLDSIFYNLNTVALHDWRVYAEMRNLAQEKYGIKMTEVHLPGTAHYSEALDILEIMRNIHIFVSRYNYNMNTQIFIERAFDQKHINSVSIDHIADSLRTHGTGISHTTVNYTYQFLIRKFKIFSEFLFDDHIKSRLSKTIRLFKVEREKWNNRLPYEHAEKFLKDIRKLGVAEDGTTFLDHFRRQVTEIGNALGYVRMVRSGGLHHCSQSIKFVPHLDDVPSFLEPLEKEMPSVAAETKEAARVLDGVLNDLQQNFSDGTNYFELLVSVFQPVLKQTSQLHLNNFYAIIPPLTINFAEKMISQKEKLGKLNTALTGRQEANFTDDGFALGLAYILRVLDQDGAFDSLHWFESVTEHLRMKSAQNQQTAAQQEKSKKSGSKRDGNSSNPNDENEIQALQLSVKKLAALKTEFDLLFYSFSGARIFFQDGSAGPSTGVEGNVKDDKKTEESNAAAAAAAAAAADGAVNGEGAPAAPAASSSDSLVVAANVPVAPPMDIPIAPPMGADVPMAPPMDIPIAPPMSADVPMAPPM